MNEASSPSAAFLVSAFQASMPALAFRLGGTAGKVFIKPSADNMIAPPAGTDPGLGG
jgi:hypothetical protein